MDKQMATRSIGQVVVVDGGAWSGVLQYVTVDGWACVGADEVQLYRLSR